MARRGAAGKRGLQSVHQEVWKCRVHASPPLLLALGREAPAMVVCRGWLRGALDQLAGESIDTSVDNERNEKKRKKKKKKKKKKKERERER
jgi:hypothetical protein